MAPEKRFTIPQEKFPKPKFGHMCCELDSMSELSGFVYIKSHVILHVKSKAQKVNSLCWLETSALELSAVANLRHQRS